MSLARPGIAVLVERRQLSAALMGGEPMTFSSMLDSAGRRRSPATLPGFHAGRAPRNKGMLYPADPPTVEEIVCVMRNVSDEARSVPGTAGRRHGRQATTRLGMRGGRRHARAGTSSRHGLRRTHAIAGRDRPGPCPGFRSALSRCGSRAAAVDSGADGCPGLQRFHPD